MRAYLIYVLLVSYGSCQYVKSGVKGGYGGHGFQQHAGENLVSVFGVKTYYGQNAQNRSDIGVCTIEVPTASLVRDPSHVPTGNGSRSDLSVIRSCCKGYVRNIHNPSICDPVCTEDCVNALCTAPETCTCFPDHVKNLAGFCVSTCPIGCQNGHCSGGECICKDGFTLDVDSRYCVPICRSDCGGFGNCTAPSTCSCRTGYQASADGSCTPICDKCTNGDCVAPNNCQCRRGYTKNENGQCSPYCSSGCAPTGKCIAPETCSNSQTSPISNSQLPYHTTNQSYPNRYPTSNYPQYPPSTNRPHSGYPNHGGPGRPSYDTNNTQYVIQQVNNPTNYPRSDSQVANTTTLQPNNPLYHSIEASSRPPPQQGSYPYPSQNPSTIRNNPNNPDYTPYPYQVNGTVSQFPNQSPYPQTYNNANNPNTFYINQPYYPNPSYIPYNPNESNNLNSPNFTTQTFNPNQPNHTYQPNYPNQPNYHNQHNYPNRPMYANQPNYPNQPSYANQPNYPNQHYPYQPYPYQPNDPNVPYSPYNPDQPSNPNHPYNPYYRPNYPNRLPHQTFTMLPNGTIVYELSPDLQYQPQNPNEPSHQGGFNGTNGYPSSNQGSYAITQNTPQFPECSEPCINGVCVEGNICVCNAGYVMDSVDQRCKPRCAGGCQNGVCSGPNLCICNMGYHKDTSVKGRSVCVKRIRRSLDNLLQKKPLNNSQE